MDTPLGQVRDEELVVDKGAEFSLTCRSDSKIDWAYNDYEPHEGEVSTGYLSRIYYRISTGYLLLNFIRNSHAQGWASGVDFLAIMLVKTILG